jgi:hypothetical protein
VINLYRRSRPKTLQFPRRTPKTWVSKQKRK